MKRLTLWLMLCACGILAAPAADYHVDSRLGNDATDGLSPKTAWQSLAKINEAKLLPGDRVLFHAGSVWRGQLVVKCQGMIGGPIRFESYGKGSRPRIAGRA
jgi:hypothetical protein